MVSFILLACFDWLMYAWMIEIVICRYKITTEKASGVLSGVQETPDGMIKWSRQLPDTCQLSQWVRRPGHHPLIFLIWHPYGQHQQQQLQQLQQQKQHQQLCHSSVWYCCYWQLLCTSITVIIICSIIIITIITIIIIIIIRIIIISSSSFCMKQRS